jgi:hypothetical protein
MTRLKLEQLIDEIWAMHSDAKRMRGHMGSPSYTWEDRAVQQARIDNLHIAMSALEAVRDNKPCAYGELDREDQ